MRPHNRFVAARGTGPFGWRSIFVRTAIIVAVLSAAAGVVWAQDLPDPVGYVNDFARLISDTDERAMERIIVAVQEQTGAEIAVVTVENMGSYGSIEQYGIALAEKWKVGPADTDEGVILIVAEAERKVRIEVGYGLEGAIPDGKAGSILDTYVVPYLKNNDYGSGLVNGVAAVAQVIADEHGVTLTGVESASAPAGSSSASEPEFTTNISRFFYLLIVLLFVGGRWFIFPLLFMGRRRGFFGGGFGTAGRSSGGFSSRSGGSFGGFSGGSFGGGGGSRGF